MRKWDEPITKPLPGPVASEAMQMNVETQTYVGRAAAAAAHRIAGHTIPYSKCTVCVEIR